MPLSNEPKILVACPTLGLDQDPDRWLNSLIKIFNNCRREGFAHALFAPYRQLWEEANNNIWNCAFENKFEYILRIDDDIHGVPEDAVSKLLAANKTVIGAAYCNRRFPYTVQAMVKVDPKKTFRESFDDPTGFLQSVQFHGYTGQHIQQVDLIGFGMTLIKVAPFKFCERPMYRNLGDLPDDSYFAQVCADNGIPQYVHWGVRINHAHVTFANAGHLYNADVIQQHPEILDDKSKVLLVDPLKPEEVNV